MKQQDVYMHDSFGLRTLDKDERLSRHVVSGVSHHEWYRDSNVFDTIIAPNLT